MKTILANWVLGPPGHQRVRVVMVLLTMAVYVTFALLQHAEVLLSFIDLQASNWLSAYYLGGSLLFYAAVRSGWSARLNPADPALTLLQTLHGVVAMVGSYAITGPARGGVLAILVLVLAFGMFSLSVRQARALALLTFVLLAGVMVWKSQTDPNRYPLWVEVIHLAFGVIVLLGISSLSVRMGALRARLQRQKQDLEASVEQIRLLATQDELTGLFNRRHMTEMLRAEQARQQRTTQRMSMVILDLDHFKRINDSYGHQAGDTVLRKFAQTVATQLRGTDVLARWGGEEFLLMLPETGAPEALQCVQRMQAALATVAFDEIAPGLQLTFSAGLAVCEPGDSVEAVIELADQALYRAKEAGRNRVVSA